MPVSNAGVGPSTIGTDEGAGSPAAADVSYTNFLPAPLMVCGPGRVERNETEPARGNAPPPQSGSPSMGPSGAEAPPACNACSTSPRGVAQPDAAASKSSSGTDPSGVSHPSRAIDTGGGHEPPVSPGGENKRRRVEVARVTPVAAAQEWMCATFGGEWREKFHRSHRLSLAKPLVYCRLCGHHCESPQHLVKLRNQCDGEPKQGSMLATRLKRIMKGEFPGKGSRRLEAPVPLPFGTRS